MNFIIATVSGWFCLRRCTNDDSKRSGKSRFRSTLSALPRPTYLSRDSHNPSWKISNKESFNILYGAFVILKGIKAWCYTLLWCITSQTNDALKTTFCEWTANNVSMLTDAFQLHLNKFIRNKNLLLCNIKHLCKRDVIIIYFNLHFRWLSNGSLLSYQFYSC